MWDGYVINQEAFSWKPAGAQESVLLGVAGGPMTQAQCHAIMSNANTRDAEIRRISNDLAALDPQLAADLTISSRKRKRGRRPPKPADSVTEQSLLRLARVLRKQASQRLRDARKKPAQFTLTTMYGEEVAALQEKRESTQCDTCKKWRIVDELGNWANEVFVCSQVGIACDEPCAGCNEQCDGNCKLESADKP
jgi:hypothetical protein